VLLSTEHHHLPSSRQSDSGGIWIPNLSTPNLWLSACLALSPVCVDYI